MPFFSDNLPPLLECEALENEWPKVGYICSNNAIACNRPLLTFDDPTTFTCECGDKWTGRGDFMSKGSKDCNISIDLTFKVLLFYLLSGITCTAVVVLWNYAAIKIAYKTARKGKFRKLMPKTLAFIGFAAEGLWCTAGVTYRLISGHRYGYYFIPTLFISISINSFLWFFYYFIVSWIKLSIASTSTGPAKAEHKKKAKQILLALKYQVCVCTAVIFSCFMYTPFIEDEVSTVREQLINAGNLLTSICIAFMGYSLYRSGRDLAEVVKQAGASDRRLTKLGKNMLKTTRILSWTTNSIATLLAFATVFTVVNKYKTYVVPITYTLSHIIPITISLLLTTPPWRMNRVAPDTFGASGSSKGSKKRSSAGWSLDTKNKSKGSSKFSSKLSSGPAGEHSKVSNRSFSGSTKPHLTSGASLVSIHESGVEL